MVNKRRLLGKIFTKYVPVILKKLSNYLINKSINQNSKQQPWRKFAQNKQPEATTIKSWKNAHQGTEVRLTT